jgi:HAD superfamily hydrolase (TIGR01549 family)
MKKVRIIGAALVASLSITFHSYYTIQASEPSYAAITTKQQCPITVIFDLGGVLMETSKRSALWQLGPRNVFSYLIRNRSIDRMKQQFFATLNRIDGSEGNPYGAKDPDGHLLPNLFATWLMGNKPNAQLLATVIAEINNHPEWFTSKQEQHLITAIAQFTFDPNNFVNAYHPIYSMVSFARQCKAKGYHLYILSNWDPESFELFTQKYPEIFNLFDEIIISGNEHIIKPDPAMFALITKKVPAQNCIFIDDQQENINAARKAGMHAILAAPKRALFSKIPDMQSLRAQFSCLERQLCGCAIAFP